MKRIVSHIIVLIAAIAIFFTGAGVNIVNYCCSGCVEQFYTLSEQHSCCSQEHNQKISSAQDCCATMVKESCHEQEIASHCTVSRLSIDLDIFHFKHQLITPFVWVSVDSLLFSTLPHETVCATYFTQLDSPPKIPPRDYLSLIRVLVI